MLCVKKRSSHKAGLLRCYISRVENGHTIPAVETLEKMARALEIPMYQLLYDREEPPKLPNLPKRKSAADIAWGSKGKDARLLTKFRRLLARVEEVPRQRRSNFMVVRPFTPPNHLTSEK